MIKQKVYGYKDQHFCVYADEPMRIEVLVVNGKVIAHVYEGDVVDIDQDPVGVYDGTIGNQNGDWKSEQYNREADARNLVQYPIIPA